VISSSGQQLPDPLLGDLNYKYLENGCVMPGRTLKKNFKNVNFIQLKGFKTLFRLLGEVVSSQKAEQMFDDGDKDSKWGCC
jgi:hypothetical protein